MIEIAIIIALLIVNYFGFSFLLYRRRFPPLFNMVLAKATCETLSEQRKQEVKDHALQIINRTWIRKDFQESNFRDEPHRLSWYALAMAELGIPPLLNTLGSQWYFVKKPHLYPFKRSSIYEDIVSRLNKESGINVSVAFPVPPRSPP